MRPPSAPKYSLDRPAEGLPAPLARDANFRRGVSLDLFVGEVEPEQRGDYAAWLDQAVRLGATDLELVVQWSQLDAAAQEIAPSATLTVDDEFLSWFMDQAHDHQLRVVLTPLIQLEGAPQSFRPALVPSDTARWFWNYHRFLLHYARIAEAHHASWFGVGADLPDALVQSEEWPRLIKDVRKAFKGKLTYAARWESFETVPFWAEMDTVALAGVGDLLLQPPAAREKALGALTQRLRSFQRTNGKPWVLSSVRTGLSASSPKDLRGSQEQLVAARALFQSLQAERSLSGAYVSLARPGAAQQPSAPSVASACAAVLRHWYARAGGSKHSP